jgi:hypothetical protein
MAVTAAQAQAEPEPATESYVVASDAPEKSGWTSAFRSAASSLPSMFASLTSKRQATGLNLKEAMAGWPEPEAEPAAPSSEPVAAAPAPIEPIAAEPADAPALASEPAELPMEVSFEVTVVEESAPLSLEEPEFLPTVDFLADISAPATEIGSIGGIEVDIPMQDDLIARLHEEAVDFSAEQMSPTDAPEVLIPTDFEIDVEAPALPAEWETPASAPGTNALQGLAESLDMAAFAAIGSDAGRDDAEGVDGAAFDVGARSDAALEAIDASAGDIAAAFRDESFQAIAAYETPDASWEASADSAFSIGDVFADETADVAPPTEAEILPPPLPEKAAGVLHMPVPAPIPVPAAPAPGAPAHAVNRESVSVRALEGFLKRIETRRRQVDKESVA